MAPRALPYVCETCGCQLSIYEQYGSFLKSILCTNTKKWYSRVVDSMINGAKSRWPYVCETWGCQLCIIENMKKKCAKSTWLVCTYWRLILRKQYGYILLHIVGFSINQYGSIRKQYGSFLQSILCTNTKKWFRELLTVWEMAPRVGDRMYVKHEVVSSVSSKMKKMAPRVGDWYRWLKIPKQYGYILLHIVGFSMN
jgi:hypothetical protein